MVLPGRPGGGARAALATRLRRHHRRAPERDRRHRGLRGPGRLPRRRLHARRADQPAGPARRALPVCRRGRRGREESRQSVLPRAAMDADVSHHAPAIVLPVRDHPRHSPVPAVLAQLRLLRRGADHGRGAPRAAGRGRHRPLLGPAPVRPSRAPVAHPATRLRVVHDVDPQLPREECSLEWPPSPGGCQRATPPHRRERLPAIFPATTGSRCMEATAGSYLRTLFLHPPSYAGFDGGAGSRYQARREIRSFWYPTWLAQPAALVPGSRLVDAPPDGLTLDAVLGLARAYDLAILHTSTPSFAHAV